MNKKCFRVIFSKTLQRLVVTSELAKTEGKSSEQASGGFSSLFCKIRPLTFSLFCALGFVAFSDTALANLIIQADKSAPKNQQPIVLQTANGLPQVNIQTPNDKGLSHNKYAKFDVDTKGAILNNSRTNVQTQQGGLITGNPYLARGEAKVILNEVNSSDPSVLKGYVEVAGKKADVIIANPSGIHCEGCGIINSDRATFTTGKPQIKNGNLESFVVEKGKVKVSGKGLDNSRVDYTEIIARETQVNAGVWSKKEAKVITGKNSVKRSENSTDLQIIHSNQPLADEARPQVAVDVGELGGMYSGKIHLIGTEKGVGVRNAGHIGASAETLKIDSEGRIVNTGTLNANHAVQLAGTKGIENRGKIENRQGDITFNTAADIQQDGSVVARSGNIHQTAHQAITQQGETVAKGRITYKAPKVTASTSSLIAAGVAIQDTPNGETRTLEKASAQGQSIVVNTTGKSTLQGKVLASNVQVNAAEANLDNSQIHTYALNVQAKAGNIQADNAVLMAEKTLNLTTPTQLQTQNSVLKAETLTTQQRSLNTNGAIWEQTGSGELKLNVADKLQNRGGTFKTQGDLTVHAQGMDNQQGRLLAKGKLTVNAAQGKVNSSGGILVSEQDITLNSGEWLNDGGLIQSHQNVTINTHGQALSNQHTLTEAQDKGIVALGQLNIQSSNLSNQQGRVVSGGNQQLTATNVNNDQGLVYTQQNLALNAQNLTNHHGTLNATQQATLALTGNLSQTAGTVEAERLNVSVGTLNSTAQSVIFADTFNITTALGFNNQDSRVVAKRDGYILTGSVLNNTRGILGSQQGDMMIDTQGHRLLNENGTLAAAKNITVTSGELHNQQGVISAQNVALETNNQALYNQNTLTNQKEKGIIAQQTLVLNAGVLNNDNGLILSYDKNKVTGSALTNHGGAILAASQLDLNSNDLIQQAGLVSANILNMVVDHIQSHHQSEISGQQVNLQAQTFDNQESKLIARQQATLDVKQELKNQQGMIASLGDKLMIQAHQSTLNNEKGIVAVENGTLQLEASALDNHQGAIQAKVATLNVQNTLNNRNTLANETQGIVATDLTLNATLIDNQGGRITGRNKASLQAETLKNQSGEILTAQDNILNTHHLDNQAGTIASVAANLSITTQSVLNNQQGKLSAKDRLVLNTKGIANQEGNITSSHQLQLNTAQHALDNQKGVIFATQQANIDAGEINNSQGLIRADSDLVINTHQHAIDNRHTQSQQQGIVSLGNVSLLGLTQLLNQQGKVYAEKALDIDVQQQTHNQQGLIKSNHTFTLNTATLDNQAGNISAKTGVITAQNIDNRAISENGSLIYGEHLTLDVAQLDNQGTKATGKTPSQGIQGADITLRTTALNNQQGGIYSSNHTSMTIEQRLDNQQGELLSGNTLSIQNGGHLMVDNQDGVIQGHHAIDLTAKGLVSQGLIKTEGDLSVSLKDSFTLNKAFEVGNNLTFKTEGDFTNNIEQAVKNKITIAANHIVNNLNAELSANETTLNSNSLTNRGLIDGNKTLINSTKVTNIGTGRIYGDHLSFRANTIENLAETLNNETKAGTIAARERLDFGVEKLINRDHALILSLGDMAIGGDLDAQGHAIGQAGFVDNGSATIEVLGDGKINSLRLLNHDLYVKTGIDTKVEKIAEHALGEFSHRYREGRDGFYDINNGSRNPNSYFQLNNGTRIEGFGWYSWFYDQTTKTTVLEYTDPAKISIGGALKLDGEDLHNKYSQLLVGTQLWLGDTAFTENAQNTSLDSGRIKLENEDIQGEINRNDEGKYRIEYRVRKKKGRRGHSHYHKNGLGYGPHDHPTEYFSFNRVLNTIGTPISSTATLESKPQAKDVQLDTVSVTTPNTEQLGKLAVPQTQLGGKTFTEITLTPEINSDEVVNSGQVIAKLHQVVEGDTVPDLANLTMPMVKTHLAEVRLPQASLYKINPDAPNGYLVETDPKFTDRKQWLSSDYMFEQLRYNHDNVHKRLGDGFYEQRLINEQINQLTGRRYIEGYNNDLAQYRALMNSGVQYAKQFNLAVGVGLTAKQMSELTTDMVWLVNKEVTLADGRKITALVPQVYLVARDSDISSRGAVISANQIVGNVGELNNSGVIAGRDLTRIHSNQLENQGTILGETVDLSAQQNLINLGGRIEAVKSLSLSAGKNLEISSTLSSAESADGNFARTVLDRLASVKVSGEGGQLNLQSAGNITVKAAQLESQGRVNANAGDALHITTLTTQNKEHYNGDADNYYRLDQKAEAGSTLTGKEGIALVANHDVTLRQAEVGSETGKVLIGSKTGDIVVEAGQAEEQLATSMKSKSRGLFSKTTTVSRHFHDNSNAVASNVDGQAVSLIAQQGNISVKGSNVVAEQDLTLMAKENVSIISDVNTHYQEDYSKTTKSGLMGSGGIGFTIGNKKETTEQDRTQESAASSQVGSLKGNTTIQAGNHYQQTGSIVTAQAGDVDIFAQTANITAARSDYESNYKYKMEQKGVTIALTGAVAAAIQAVDSTVKSAKTVGSSKNNRVNVMAAANVGFEAMRAGESLAALGKEAMTNGVGQAASSGVGVSITYGQQKTEQTQHSEGNTAEKSQVNAGGKVHIQATGKGEQSHLTIEGADVSGQGGTHLKAEGNVNILAADENHLERSKNKSSGFNVGVAIQIGGGLSAGITAGGNVAKGYGNGESQAWVASQVGSENSKTTIESGKDTNVIGSQVKGKRVEVSAENLNIESLQDTARYEGKQESIQGQVTVGYGVSAGGSYSKSKVNSNYASVKTQAGIYAGDEGYDVDVSKGVQLTGGAILSQSDADKNALSAQDFSFTDITNYSDAKASSSSFMGGFSIGKDQRSDEEKAKDQVYRAERENKGETFEKANPNQANSSPVKFGLGEKDVHSADLYAAAKIGLVNLLGNTEKSQQASSTTSSIISEGHFNIGSAEGREKLNRIKKGNSEQTNSLEQQNYQELQKEVENDTAIQKNFYKNVAGLTDEAYRTMFIAEHRMLTAVVDKNGNPIKDKNLEKDLNDEAVQFANEKLEKGEITKEQYQEEIRSYVDSELGKGRNIYQLREVSDQEREYIKPVTYTDPLTGKSETKYVVTFNGIFNDENAAAKFAWQNYVAREGASGKIDTPIYQDVYFVHHPQANNFLSELLVAGYEKMIETSFGNVFGMDNSSLQAKSLMEKYGKDHLFAGAHSRGTLTVTNALNALNTEGNREAKLLSGTTIKMVGPAADVTHADEVLSGLQTGKQRESSEGSIRIENHQQDPVGSLPILLGGNPATMNDNTQNRGFIRRILDMFGDNSSMHNCYGLGQKQCVTDGYRKEEKDLIMNNEQTIYDLNQKKELNK